MKDNRISYIHLVEEIDTAENYDFGRRLRRLVGWRHWVYSGFGLAFATSLLAFTQIGDEAPAYRAYQWAFYWIIVVMLLHRQAIAVVKVAQEHPQGALGGGLRDAITWFCKHPAGATFTAMGLITSAATLALGVYSVFKF
ncbi:hypothetical protein UCD39_13520 [Nitrospirillum sp. BR 11752]|uniref:hypothetical protein n=1 Tax=Nitrospirillum sp. BR 11752 TaxID=3104293 RepID=UPI002EA7ECE1|nr:hypothetical protein [Nitrospirillum sp. BR 11752]